MASLESGIDDLYRGPLEGFVAARTALARTLSGAEAKQAKALQKPAAAAWAVNQVYWHARPSYERLIKAGGALRTAQVAALGGRSADVQAATDAHRKALAVAVKEAMRLAADAGVNPNHDALTQTFESLSLATKQTEPPGRLTKALQPAGFEALAGITVKAPDAPRREERAASSDKRQAASMEADPGSAHQRADRERQAKEAAREEREARQREAEIKSAQAALEQAQEAESAARSEWQHRKRDLEAAEQTLARLRKR